MNQKIVLKTYLKARNIVSKYIYVHILLIFCVIPFFNINKLLNFEPRKIYNEMKYMICNEGNINKFLCNPVDSSEYILNTIIYHVILLIQEKKIPI
jgi:hypothetical protein